LLAFDKPSGLRVIQDGYDKTLPTLVRELEPAWGRLFVVHRLDKDTSGVILFARDAISHRSMNQQFASRQVKKTYQALVVGSPEWDEKTIELPLKVDGDRGHRTVLNEQEGKPASTIVRVLTRFGNYSLVEVHPFTGYTHQIRAHLSAVGFPLLGDPLYRYPPQWSGPRTPSAAIPPFPRTALHAAHISFRHPVSDEWLTIEAPSPSDFRELLDWH